MRLHQAHVDAVAIAEFREGLIGGRRAARIAGHLTGCEQCAGIEAGLARVTALLAADRQPAMPDRLARRVTEALAGEAAARSLRGPRADPAVAPAALNDQSRLLSTERVRRITGPLSGRGLAARGFAGAAAACLLAAGGYTLARFGPFGSSAAPSRAQAGPAVNGHGPGNGIRSYPYAVKPTFALAGTSPPTSFTVILSSTDYQPPASHLAQQVEEELAKLSFGAGRRPGQPDDNVQADALDSCVKWVTGGATPTLVEIAHYAGKPAKIVVFGGHVSVVGPRCTTVLAHASLPGGP